MYKSGLECEIKYSKMREILFRGKRIDNGEWVQGDLLTNNGDPIIVVQVDREYIGRTHTEAGAHWYIHTPAYRLDPSTVGQYTGLKDLEGNEIFEGDVIRSTFPKDDEFDAVDYICDYAIKCEDGCFWAVDKEGNQAPAYAHLDPEDNISVLVGSIHDNPIEK